MLTLTLGGTILFVVGFLTAYLIHRRDYVNGYTAGARALQEQVDLMIDRLNLSYRPTEDTELVQR